VSTIRLATPPGKRFQDAFLRVKSLKSKKNQRAFNDTPFDSLLVSITYT